MSSMDGKIVAVTGGARGIGREIAAQLAQAGAQVGIGDRDGDAARTAADTLGSRVRGFDLDVADRESFAAFLDAVAAEFGPIDVLVNNAGVMWVGPFDEEPEAARRRQFDVNVHGVVNGVTLAAPAMRARGRGHVVTVASAAAKLSPAGESTYAATKHAVLGYLTGVRWELAGTGVDITAIMPGVVDTELAVGTATGAARMLTPAHVAAAVLAAIEKPRFEITIPRYVGPLVGWVNILPQRIRDVLLRRMVPNQVDAVANSSARHSYEQQFTNPDQSGEAQ